MFATRNKRQRKRRAGAASATTTIAATTLTGTDPKNKPVDMETSKDTPAGLPPDFVEILEGSLSDLTPHMTIDHSTSAMFATRNKRQRKRRAGAASATTTIAATTLTGTDPKNKPSPFDMETLKDTPAVLPADFMEILEGSLSDLTPHMTIDHSTSAMFAKRNKRQRKRRAGAVTSAMFATRNKRQRKRRAGAASATTTIAATTLTETDPKNKPLPVDMETSKDTSTVVPADFMEILEGSLTDLTPRMTIDHSTSAMFATRNKRQRKRRAGAATSAMFGTRNKRQRKRRAGAASATTTIAATTLTGTDPKNKPVDMETSKDTPVGLPADFMEILEESISDLTPRMTIDHSTSAMFGTRNKRQRKRRAGAASATTTIAATTLTGTDPKNKALPVDMEASKDTSAVLPADFMEILEESLSDLTPRMTIDHSTSAMFATRNKRQRKRRAGAATSAMFETRNKRQRKRRAGAASATTTIAAKTLTGTDSKNKPLPVNMETSKDTSAVLPADFMEILEETLSDLTPRMVKEILSKINQPQKLNLTKGPSVKTEKKKRKRFRLVGKYRRQVNISKINESPNARPYIAIEVNGQPIQGLLQIENAVTCLGKGCRKFVKAAKLVMYPCSHTIKTVDGREHKIKGRATGQVTWNNATRSINFYLVPTLKINLSVGRNVINAFTLGPADQADNSVNH